MKEQFFKEDEVERKEKKNDEFQIKRGTKKGEYKREGERERGENNKIECQDLWPKKRLKMFESCVNFVLPQIQHKKC